MYPPLAPTTFPLSADCLRSAYIALTIVAKEPSDVTLS